MNTFVNSPVGRGSVLNPARALLSIACLTLAGAMSACEESAPPGAATSKQNSAPLAGLSDSPQSVLGKSAAMAKNVAKQGEQSQAAAGGLADELSGQAGVVSVGGVEFRPPASWEKTPPSNRMQAAALRVAPDAGEGDTQCVFLTSIGGSTQQNIDRWRGQVTDPSSGQPAESSVESRTIAGMKVTLVSMSGTYASMVSGATTPLTGQGFRGAIVEAPGGSIFVRMTGPKDAVDAASDAWKQMVLGMRKQ